MKDLEKLEVLNLILMNYVKINDFKEFSAMLTKNEML